MSTKPDKTVLKYRDKLDKLGIKWEESMNRGTLKDLLEKAVKGSSDEVENEASLEAAKEELDGAVQAELAEVRAQLADMKKMLSNVSTTSPTLTPELIAAIAHAGKNEVKDGLVDPTYIKPEDEMPKEKVYYRYGPTHNIWHGYKAGVKTPLPYDLKNIKFKQSAGWVTRSGNSAQQRRLSIFVTKNRKISEFIEGHAEFGITIHLDRDKAFNSTVAGRFMDLYNRHYQSLQGQPLQDLARIGSEMGMGTSMGYTHHDYSVKIAEQRALTELEGDKSRFEEQMRALNIDKKLLQNT
jgi:hypothetical protein